MIIRDVVRALSLDINGLIHPNASGKRLAGALCNQIASAYGCSLLVLVLHIAKL